MLVFAIGLILSGISGQAQEQADGEQSQTTTENYNTDRFSIPVTIVENQAAADARQRSESESSQREIDDLIAQQGMNSATQAMQRATEDMRRYSYVQTWLIGIGTALLLATLWLTTMANNAARAAVDVTRQVGQAQARAYLSLKVEIPDDGPNPKQAGIMVIVTVTNSGVSPAINTSIHIHIRWYPVDAFESIEITNWKSLSHGLDVGAQGASAFGIFKIPINVVQGVRDGTYEMEIAIKLSFFDVFAIPHSDEHRYYICGSNFSIPMPSAPWGKQLKGKN